MQKLFIILFVLMLHACGSSQHKTTDNMQQKETHKFTNKLISETSPYLLQHAHNPVDWYPWGDEAFEKARKEDKLVLISIGYAACHWCHVMEHESFEDEEVAKIMNDHFVCIKVDREERPDVDHTYMDAVQLMTGSGGWPLNCFALADGRPVFGGTYFRKEHWKSILNQLNEVYMDDKQRVYRSAEELMKGINQHNLVSVNQHKSEFSEKQLEAVLDNWKPNFDKADGGNQGAPKFPMPSNYFFLFKYYYYSGDKDVLNHLEKSLDKIAAGGIYDHLGGGFARYSTDAEWKVPHFEKMLYDNAQLVSVYALAYKLFQKEAYKNVVFETLDFVDRELTSPKGNFYSSIDADSDGEEGTFYIWTKEDIDLALGKDAAIFNSFYGITDSGNWEHAKNVLHQHLSIEKVAETFDLSPDEISESIIKSRNILFKIRSKRERPITDDKVLTSWNALMISAFVNAYRTFGEEDFLESALKAAEFIQLNCINDDGKVLRMARSNSDIPGFLDDYGLLAQAFIDLYQVSFDEKWLHTSKLITDFSLQHFYNENNGMFYYSSLDESVTISRKTEISDNVIPSSNSVMAVVLSQLSYYMDNEDYFDKSEKMLNNVVHQIEQAGRYYSNWANLLCDFVYEPPEIVFTGNHAVQLRQEYDSSYLYGLVAGSTQESELPLLKNRVLQDQSLIYICRNRVCKLPVNSLYEAIKQMDSAK